MTQSVLCKFCFVPSQGCCGAVEEDKCLWTTQSMPWLPAVLPGFAELSPLHCCCQQLAPIFCVVVIAAVSTRARSAAQTGAKLPFPC